MLIAGGNDGGLRVLIVGGLPEIAGGRDVDCRGNDGGMRRDFKKMH